MSEIEKMPLSERMLDYYIRWRERGKGVQFSEVEEFSKQVAELERENNANRALLSKYQAERQVMELVIQCDPKGCGIACCAMVCGHSYAEAKAKVASHCWDGRFTHYDAFEYLNLHGFSYQHWYRSARFMRLTEDGNFLERITWPIKTPLADAHILLTRGPEMDHWTAMDDKGEVFDPARGRGKQIQEYEIMQIIAAWERKP